MTRLFGTLIVAAWNQDHIYIAADSRTWKNSQFSDTTCKITRAGTWFLARAGYFETVPNGQTIQERILIAAQTNDARVALKTLRPIIAQEFTAMMQWNKRNSRADWKEIFSRETDEIAYVLLCGFIGNTAVVELTYWKLRIALDGTPIVTDEVQLLPMPNKGRMAYQYLGQTWAIARAYATNANFGKPLEADPLEFVRHLANFELNSKLPPGVQQGIGAPFDIVHIHHAGYDWVERKPECSEDLTIPVATNRASFQPSASPILPQRNSESKSPDQ